jgi:dienelactone hydrolase
VGRNASRRRAGVFALVLLLGLGAASVAWGFDATLEAKNFAKVKERFQYITSTPEFQARLQQQNVASPQQDLNIQTTDPERDYTGNICGHRTNECAGDVRFYDWPKDGFGIRRPVLFTARDGATISGNVWATRSGPKRRPAIVLTTGSVQAPETLYWGLAATFAKHGYVVLTYDVQGQGRSDTFGEAPDTQEGVPSQAGQPFYDGTEDALDFLLSSKGHPYAPRPSCGNANGGVGTSHATKQKRRVKAGLDSAFDPLRGMIDPTRIGIAGHSLGAAAVSFVGQEDPRVDATVAWDNLGTPDGGSFGVPDCPSAPKTRKTPKITKPALGMSNDYSLVAEPYTSDPGPLSHNDGFATYKKAGVDSMQVNIRGGTHYEYSFIPGNTAPYPLGAASLRGEDVAAWYSTAWFDRYVKCRHRKRCQANADRRLLTGGWRDDKPAQQVDTNNDPNDFSFYLRSQYAFHKANGHEVTCGNMRAGCGSMDSGGGGSSYSFVADADRPDKGSDATPQACALPQGGSSGADHLKGTDAGDALRGRGGNDRLTGGPAGDCLYGGGGRDQLSGGPDRDRLSGGTGIDRLIAIDPSRDVVDCGPGAADRARVSPNDVARNCEHITRTAR